MSPFKEIDNYNIPNVATLTDEDIFGKLITKVVLKDFLYTLSKKYL